MCHGGVLVALHLLVTPINWCNFHSCNLHDLNATATHFLAISLLIIIIILFSPLKVTVEYLIILFRIAEVPNSNHDSDISCPH